MSSTCPNIGIMSLIKSYGEIIYIIDSKKNNFILIDTLGSKRVVKILYAK